MAISADVWKAHCQHMAGATFAIADWCEDPEMLRDYLALAAKWISLSDGPPPIEMSGGEWMAEERQGGGSVALKASSRSGAQGR